jgi:hypothetical protein
VSQGDPTLAIVPGVGAVESQALVGARARLAAVLAEVSALDTEVETLDAALAAFAAELERRLGPADLAARRAAATVRRLQALAGALADERARVQAGGTTRRRRPRARSAPRLPAPEDDASGAPFGEPDAEPEPADAGQPVAEALRRVYRRLARLLHPDLAGDEADRERLTTLMAQVNAAYAAEDLQGLELTAEKLGAGETPGLVTEAERLTDLARRDEQLRRVAASLHRTLERLEGSDTARLRHEAARRAAAGADYFQESEAELRDEAVAARADALARLAGLEQAALALAAARKEAMADLERRGARGLRRAFDPLAESQVVRRSALRLSRAQAGPEARALARWLEEAAVAAPAEAALSLLAFFAEAGGEQPPPTLATAAGLAERWEALRPAWPGTPDLGTTLSQLPSHLTVGARAGREAVLAGLQLASAGLSAGVRLALAQPAVAALARQVLGALGPQVRCDGCRGEVRALHVLATRGLDERHALLCPTCGASLRRYWRFGAVEGLEALAPLSLQVELTAEAVLRLGEATLGFGMLPRQRAALTAQELLARFEALYLEPCGVELPRGALALRAGGEALDGRALVPASGTLSLTVTRTAGTTAGALVELLRTRVERRFRPGP